MSPILALTLTAALTGPATAPPAPLLTQAVRLAEAAALLRPAAGATPPQGDSLRNGAVVGAVVGALVAGAFVGLYCNATNDGDDRGSDCLKATLLYAAIGGAGGAAVGAGVDALFDRPMAVVRYRF